MPWEREYRLPTGAVWVPCNERGEPDDPSISPEHLRGLRMKIVATATTWPELVAKARGYLAGGDGRTNRQYAEDFAIGIVGMDAELQAIMAPSMLRAVRLYTDELGALRTRVAELEAEIHERDHAAMERSERDGG